MTYVLSRRNFISFSAAMLAAILGSAGHVPGIISRNRTLTRLGKIFARDLQSAREVGHIYFREAPQEHNADILTKMIMQSDMDLMQRLDVLSEADIIAKLRNLIAEDFAFGNTVQVDGWVLSRTEARLCALCALL